MHTHHEKYRPQFHFTVQRGWIGDANGLVYYRGEYHLFYQNDPAYKPGNSRLGPRHWGHAVSSDLLHWQELPSAILPVGNTFMAFSGSGLVDWKNTAGFKTGDNDVIVLNYTRTGKGQSLAFSNDCGRTWQEYQNNPVLPYPQEVNEENRSDYERDPKVFWHQPSGQWIMVLYVDKNKGFTFFASDDLKSWKEHSRFPDMYECPDFFELPVDKNDAHRKWILMDGSGKYFIGNFDGQRFTPETPPITNGGPHFYAAQTWSDMPCTDARRIQIAWMRCFDSGLYPGMPFSQQMTFPCELQLRAFPEGIRLCRKPIREIELLHREGHTWENVLLTSGGNPLHSIDNDLLHLKIDIELQNAEEIELNLRGVEILYSVKEQNLTVTVGETAHQWPILENRIQWEILLDRTSLELFADSSRTCVAWCFVPEEDKPHYSISAKGGVAKINTLQVFPLRSAWNVDS